MSNEQVGWYCGWCDKWGTPQPIVGRALAMNDYYRHLLSKDCKRTGGNEAVARIVYANEVRGPVS